MAWNNFKVFDTFGLVLSVEIISIIGIERRGPSLGAKGICRCEILGLDVL